MMNRFEVGDRVRIIEAPPGRPDFLNQTGRVLAAGKLNPENLVYVKLDKSSSKFFFEDGWLAIIE